jgi:hypothetical protein
MKENLIKEIIDNLSSIKEYFNIGNVDTVIRSILFENKIFFSKKKYFDYIELEFGDGVYSHNLLEIRFGERESKYGFYIHKEIYFLNPNKVNKFFNKLTILQLQSFLIEIKHFIKYNEYSIYRSKYRKTGRKTKAITYY